MSLGVDQERSINSAQKSPNCFLVNEDKIRMRSSRGFKQTREMDRYIERKIQRDRDRYRERANIQRDLGSNEAKTDGEANIQTYRQKSREAT